MRPGGVRSACPSCARAAQHARQVGSLIAPSSLLAISRASSAHADASDGARRRKKLFALLAFAKKVLDADSRTLSPVGPWIRYWHFGRFCIVVHGAQTSKECTHVDR